jgi:hypothetical protein
MTIGCGRGGGNTGSDNCSPDTAGWKLHRFDSSNQRSPGASKTKQDREYCLDSAPHLISSVAWSSPPLGIKFNSLHNIDPTGRDSRCSLRGLLGDGRRVVLLLQEPQHGSLGTPKGRLPSRMTAPPRSRCRAFGLSARTNRHATAAPARGCSPDRGLRAFLAIF